MRVRHGSQSVHESSRRAVRWVGLLPDADAGGVPGVRIRRRSRVGGCARALLSLDVDALVGVGCGDVVHRGGRREPEQVHQRDWVGRVAGLVQYAVGAQLRGMNAEPGKVTVQVHLGDRWIAYIGGGRS